MAEKTLNITTSAYHEAKLVTRQVASQVVKREVLGFEVHLRLYFKREEKGKEMP